MRRQLQFLRKSHLMIICTLAAVLLFFLTADAAPPVVTDVTGELSQGGSISVTGIDFGPKATAGPIKYEDFEWGADGDSLDGSFWETRADDQPSPKPDMTISDSGSHGGSRSGRAIINSVPPGGAPRSDKAWVNNLGFAQTGKAYVNFWMYWDWGTAIDHPDKGDDFQIKALYLGDVDDGRADMTPGCYLIGWQHQAYADGVGYNWSYLTVHGADSIYIRKAPNFTSQHNTIGRTPGWYNIIYQVDMGTPGLSDGEIKVWISSSEGEAYSYGSDANQMIIAGSEDYYDAVRIGWYRGDTSYGHTALYYDDIYMDNSFARVEIGDAATYDACTHREVQIPIDWSDTSLTLAVNTGSFSLGESVYLFVVHEDGSISDGHGPLTVASESTSTNPSSTPGSNGNGTDNSASGGCFLIQGGR